MPDLVHPLDSWPFLRQQGPDAWAVFARVLADKGKADQSAQLALAALRHPACDGPTRAIASRILRSAVPAWHWLLVKDTARNAAYEAALRRAMTPESHVLDIGAGTGLLGMMAARAGAERVVGCEMNPAVAQLAAEIVRTNGFDRRVRIIPKHSRDLRIGEDLERPVDILVSEIVNNGLLEQGVLPTHADAVSRLLRPGGTVIPAAGSIMVALGFDPKLDTRRMSRHEGFDLSAFNILDKPVYHRSVGSAGLRILSDEASLFRFAFGAPDSWPDRQTAVTVTARDGEANAIIQWIRLEMDQSGEEDSVYETKPRAGASSCWGVNLLPLNRPLPLAEGTRHRIAGRYTDTGTLIWLEDSRSGGAG